MSELLFKKVNEGGVLSAQESAAVFHFILSGQASHDALVLFLKKLAQRGETEDEVLGAARALRETMQVFEGAQDAIDLVGTGGDGLSTFNISTAAMFVLAGAGVRVAKHGNRAVSSQSGATDILTALGIRADAPQAIMQKSLRETNVCYLAAPLYHSAMRHAAPARGALKTRTIFNLLGPLANPAQTQRQLVGVYDKKWLNLFAHILRQLGSTACYITHGDDGMDEITTTGFSTIAILKDDHIDSLLITPEAAGLKRATLESLKGGDARHNAGALTALLAGQQGPYRDIVMLNAAFAFMLAGKAAHVADGIAQAAASLDSGRARKTLDDFARITQEKA